MKELENISQRIKYRREYLNYTQKDLAELTGISERTIRSIENAEVSTGIMSWYKILDVLGLEMKITVKPMSDEQRTSFLQ